MKNRLFWGRPLLLLEEFDTGEGLEEGPGLRA